MGANYPRLTITEFGRHLFKSGDLDPVYTALQAARGAVQPDDLWLARWLIAYWCFYSAGFASYAAQAEGRDFWRVMMIAAENKVTTPFAARWPRGAERRHFRGAAAVKAVDHLSVRYGPRPENMIDFLCSGAMGVKDVIARAQTHVMFGPWIAFKVADMIDIFCQSVSQLDLSAFLYDTPAESIRTSFPAFGAYVSADDGYEQGMRWLRNQLDDCRIPHKPGMSPDWFSLETVWCKHLSHLHGHYPLDKDTIELHHGVAPWAGLEPGRVARAFLAGLPPLPAKDLFDEKKPPKFKQAELW